MSNKTARLTLNLTYKGVDGETVTVPTVAFDSPYQSQMVGTIDHPDGTTATCYEIPFGAIGTDATLILVTNNTSNEIKFKFNSDDTVQYSVAAGGICIPKAAALASTCDQLVRVRVLTHGTQVGDGLISFRVFGDPVTP
jgi:hypothetical protein